MYDIASIIIDWQEEIVLSLIPTCTCSAMHIIDEILVRFVAQ